MSDSYDSPWKEMLERYFPDFMAYFFADAHRGIDWSRGYESQDQELQKILRDAELGKRLADKLMKVWRIDGEEQYVFIHVEVQGDHDAGFGERMFVYHYRLYDRHRCPIVSLAVLGDDSATWRPDSFGYELWGCRIGLSFPIVKLRDIPWRELEASDNRFATMVMAHLETGATRHDPTGRLQSKLRLVRRLYQGGYDRQDVLDLFWFIDWLLALPPELEERFEDELERLETETRMRYVTSIERKGIEKGREEGIQLGIERGVEQGIQQGVEQGIQQGVERGIQQGEASVLRRLLQRRFHRLPDWAEQRLEHASRGELEAWSERILDARALEEVFSRASASKPPGSG